MPLPEFRLLPWLLLILLFNIGCSVIFCFNSLLSGQGVNQTLIFTVMVLPLTFPLFGAGYITSLVLLKGGELLDPGSQIKIILGINLFSIAMVQMLLPYIWKN